MGINGYRVAKAIGVQQRRVDEICAAARGITAESAVRLGLAFDIDPQFWLNLQAQYDIEVIQRYQGAQLAEASASFYACMQTERSDAMSGSIPSPGAPLNSRQPALIASSGGQSKLRSGFGFASTSSKLWPLPRAANTCAEARRPMPAPR